MFFAVVGILVSLSFCPVGLSDFFGKVVFWKLQIHKRGAASEDFQAVKAKR